MDDEEKAGSGAWPFHDFNGKWERRMSNILTAGPSVLQTRVAAAGSSASLTALGITSPHRLASGRFEVVSCFSLQVQPGEKNTTFCVQHRDVRQRRSLGPSENNRPGAGMREDADEQHLRASTQCSVSSSDNRRLLHQQNLQPVPDGTRWYTKLYTRWYPARVSHLGYLHLKFKFSPYILRSLCGKRWYPVVPDGTRASA